VLKEAEAQQVIVGVPGKEVVKKKK